MQWKGRRYCKHIAALLCLLSFLGIAAFLVHEGWRRESSPGNAKLSEESDHPGDHPGAFTGDHPGAFTGDHPGAFTGDLTGDHPGDHPGAFTGDHPGAFTGGLTGPYIINESNKCPEGEPPPFLVFLILSEAHQVEARNALRQTWGNEGLAPGLGVIRLFLLGVKEGELGRLQQRTLESESQRHHDIVQQDFLDTYHNLTIKVLMGMNWVATHCPRASYVMKVDSDVLVNTDYLIHKLLRPELKPKTNYITGAIMRGGRPIRDKRNKKYYMPPEDYPSNVYPTYCSGPGYVFSGDMATEMYRASLSIPLLRFEDVYVGVCLAKLGITPTPPPRGLFNSWGLPYSRFKYNNVVTVHGFYPTQLLQYWHKMQGDKRLTPSKAMDQS